MKKVALISTFCDTEEKVNVLTKTIGKIKELGIDVIAISPNFINLPHEVIRKCDHFFYTKDNPVLNWPVRMYTHWYEMPITDNRITTLKRGLPDYNWAALHQAKRLSQLALLYDYDIFYHMIYDVEIDDKIVKELLGDEVNVVHSRIDPHNSDMLWETTLHLMIFDRPTMELIEKEITLENFLETNGMAEGEVLKWKNKFGLKISEHPVKDLIFYWGDKDFFDYEVHKDFKFFISKNEEHNIYIGQDPPTEVFVNSNLKMVFHSYKDEYIKEFGVTVIIDRNPHFIIPNEWEIYEFPVSSQNVEKIEFFYKGNYIDFTEKFKEIMINQIYYNYRHLC